MKITFDSELMKNQTHAVLISPNIAFEVLQSQDGSSLFFSIGTDHVLYLTQELTATPTGWNKIDLSSGLSSQFNGAMVTAKSFSVAQNPQTQAIDLGLVVTIANVDYLFLSLGNANTDASWANGVTWTAIPFDAGTAPSPLTITNVYLMNLQSDGGTVENIFVDILSSPGNTLEPILRYYITPGSSPQWNAHFLAAEMAAGSITSCLGNRPGDPVPGIYTMGTIGNEEQFIFTPQYNYFRPDSPPNPTRLTVPNGATTIASALNSKGVTNLFTSGSAGLSVFAPANQGEGATAVVPVSNPLTAGASQLAACTSGGKTAVWGVNAQSGLFYVQCPEGSEATFGAWSNPVPLAPAVESFAFFLNLNAGTNVVFANIDGQNLIQLTQDPTTGNWVQRAIMLPPTAVNDMVEYDSFTTHIQITDDYGAISPNAAVSLTATSPVSVYVNSVYHVLNPATPLNVTADATGVITVVQVTQSLSAICLQAVLTDTPAVTASINPMTNALATLGTVTDGTSLGNVVVTNNDGTQQPLVPSGTSSGDLDSAASSIVQFHQIATGLPQNGSRQQPTAEFAASLASKPATKQFGMRFTSGKLEYFEGPQAAAALQLDHAAFGATADSNPIVVAAEDFFEWLKSVFDKIENFFVHAIEGIYHFIVTIADEVYDVLLDCISSVVHAVEFIFNKIKVFFEDLIKWLGFIFNWKDMMNTHRAVKNVLKQCVIRAVNQISVLETDVKNAFQGLEDHLNSWAGLPAQNSNVGSYQSTSSGTPGIGKPQSNWALHHTKSNASSATTTYSMPNADTSTFQQIFDDLEQMIDTEIDDIKTAITQLKTDVIDPISTLTPIQVIQKTVAIILDFVLSTAENLIVTSLEIIQVIVEGIVDLLDATISIPILSPLYRAITGDDLSFLDLVCLVAAIPATIIYKFAMNKAPYSDADAQTIANAADFAALQQIFGGSSSSRMLTAGAAPEATAAAGDSNSLLDTTTLVVDFVALFGTLITIVAAVLKVPEEGTDTPPPAPLRYLAACAYFPYVGPDIIGAFNDPGEWYVVMNDVVTVVAILKTLADNSDCLNEDTPANSNLNKKWRDYISPVAECLINGVWLAPAIGAIASSNSKASDWTSFVSNMAFDIGGIATPATSNKIVSDEEVNGIVFVAIQVLNGIYGVLCAGTGIALAEQNSSGAAVTA